MARLRDGMERWGGDDRFPHQRERERGLSHAWGNRMDCNRDELGRCLAAALSEPDQRVDSCCFITIQEDLYIWGERFDYPNSPASCSL